MSAIPMVAIPFENGDVQTNEVQIGFNGEYIVASQSPLKTGTFKHHAKPERPRLHELDVAIPFENGDVQTAGTWPVSHTVGSDVAIPFENGDVQTFGRLRPDLGLQVAIPFENGDVQT